MARKGQERLPLVTVGLAMMLSLGGDLTLYAVLPVDAPSLGLSLGQVGILLSANRLVRLLGNPLAGLLIDKKGHRRLFLWGLGLGTMSTLSYVVSSTFWHFLLGRLLWGVSWSLIYVGAYTVMTDVTGRDEWGRGSGILQAFLFIGMAVSPLLGGIAASWLGFRLTFMLCTLTAALGFGVAYCTLPETLPDRDSLSLDAEEPRSRLEKKPWLSRLHPSLLGRWLTLHTDIVAAGLLYALSSFAGDGVVMSTISLYVKQQYGERLSVDGLVLPVASVGGSLVALRTLVAAVAAPISGRLSDRGRSRWLVTGCGAGIGLAGLILLTLEGNPALLAASVAMVGLSGGVLGAVVPAFVADQAATKRRGAVMGGLMTVEAFGSFVGPFMSYSLLAVVSLKQVYLISALAMAVGLLVWWLLSSRARHVLSGTNQSENR